MNEQARREDFAGAPAGESEPTARQDSLRDADRRGAAHVRVFTNVATSSIFYTRYLENASGRSLDRGDADRSTCALDERHRETDGKRA